LAKGRKQGGPVPPARASNGFKNDRSISKRPVDGPFMERNIDKNSLWSEGNIQKKDLCVKEILVDERKLVGKKSESASERIE
jgi:hypothetical protein